MSINESKNEIIEKIKNKFKGEYNISAIDNSNRIKNSDIMELERQDKYMMYPYIFQILIVESTITSTCDISVNCFGDRFTLIQAQDYLNELDNIFSKISDMLNIYNDFLQKIAVQLKSIDTDKKYEDCNIDFMLNSCGVLYIKDLYSGKMILIRISPNNSDFVDSTINYIQLKVEPVCGFTNFNKELMTIYIPTDNIDNTVDALLFFLV